MDQQAFFRDLVEAAQALDAAFGPTKMNVEILGNSVPHLHCHLVPRYYGDPAPGRPMPTGATNDLRELASLGADVRQDQR